jgi:hypothetical protein
MQQAAHGTVADADVSFKEKRRSDVADLRGPRPKRGSMRLRGKMPRCACRSRGSGCSSEARSRNLEALAVPLPPWLGLTRLQLNPLPEHLKPSITTGAEALHPPSRLDYRNAVRRRKLSDVFGNVISHLSYHRHERFFVGLAPSSANLPRPLQSRPRPPFQALISRADMWLYI